MTALASCRPAIRVGTIALPPLDLIDNLIDRRCRQQTELVRLLDKRVQPLDTTPIAVVAGRYQIVAPLLTIGARNVASRKPANDVFNI